MSDENLNQNDSSKNGSTKYVDYSVRAGILEIIFGGLLVGFNIITINSLEKYYPKLTGIGLVFLCSGLAMLALPGKDVVYSDKKNVLKDLFYESSGLVKAVWIIFMIAGLASVFVLIFTESWDPFIVMIFSIVALASVISIIRFIVHLFKSEGDEFEREKIVYSYTNPSKKTSAIGLIISLIIVFASCYEICSTAFGASLFYSINVNIRSSKKVKEYGHLISENLDKKVPVHIIDVDGPVCVIELTSLNGGFELYSGNDVEESVTMELGEITSVMLSEFSTVNKLVFMSEDDDVVFKTKELKKIKKVSEYAKNHPLNYGLLFRNSKLLETFYEENYNNFIVFSYPIFSNEYIKVWDFETFLSVYSELVSEDAPETIEDLITLFSENNLRIAETSFFLSDLEFISKEFSWKSENPEVGFIINYIPGKSGAIDCVNCGELADSDLTEDEE